MKEENNKEEVIVLKRDEVINNLTEYYLDVIDNDNDEKIQILKFGFKGFENLSDKELEDYYLEAYNEDIVICSGDEFKTSIRIINKKDENNG